MGGVDRDRSSVKGEHGHEWERDVRTAQCGLSRSKRLAEHTATLTSNTLQPHVYRGGICFILCHTEGKAKRLHLPLRISTGVDQQ